MKQVVKVVTASTTKPTSLFFGNISKQFHFNSEPVQDDSTDNQIMYFIAGLDCEIGDEQLKDTRLGWMRTKCDRPYTRGGGFMKILASSDPDDMHPMIGDGFQAAYAGHNGEIDSVVIEFNNYYEVTFERVIYHGLILREIEVYIDYDEVARRKRAEGKIEGKDFHNRGGKDIRLSLEGDDFIENNPEIPERVKNSGYNNTVLHSSGIKFLRREIKLNREGCVKVNQTRVLSGADVEIIAYEAFMKGLDIAGKTNDSMRAFNEWYEEFMGK